MEDVLDTLLLTARDLLKPGGRLVYFLPTVTAECVGPYARRLHLLQHGVTDMRMKTYLSFSG